MYPLGWCVGKRHCDECPGMYQSKIDLNAVDACICDCHDV